MEHAETPRELEELEARAPVPPARVAPVVVPRRMQPVLLPLSLVGLWALVRAAGPVVLLFTIAGLVALLLNPFVRLVQRSRVPRGVAVGAVYLLLGVLLATAIVLLSQPVGDQVAAFSREVPSIVDD